MELSEEGRCVDNGHERVQHGAAHQLGQLEAVHARHLHIENGQGELMSQQQLQRLLGRFGLVHPDARRLQQRIQSQQVLRQVIDDEQVHLVVTVGHGHSSSRNSR